MDKVPFLLMKFGQEAHMKALQSGELYMRQWKYFSECEADTERFDPCEGTRYWLNPGKTSMEINDHIFTRGGGTLNASFSFPDDDCYIFCMCGLYKNDSVEINGALFDERVRKLGDTFLAIVDVRKFYERIETAMQRKPDEIRLARGCAVSYFDEKEYNGEVGPFRKSSRYAYLKEWRLAIESNVDDCPPSYTLMIGDISDISILGKTTEFKNKIERDMDGAINIRC